MWGRARFQNSKQRACASGVCEELGRYSKRVPVTRCLDARHNGASAH
jgi:hypothetical protein